MSEPHLTQSATLLYDLWQNDVDELKRLRAEASDLRKRIRLARRYLGSVSTGDIVQGSLVLAAHRALDLRRPLKRGWR